MKKVKKQTGLSEIKLVPGKSMDEIDNASFGAGPSPMDSKATEVKLRGATIAPAAGAPVLTLDGVWQMAEAGDERARLADGEWTDAIPAQVPGSVHAALVAAGKLPDPTVGRNQPIVAQASYKTWWFRTTFPRPAGTTGERLVFDGVCNRCTVWLNGRRLGEHEGMFGGPEFDVGGMLEDRNTLIVRLAPIPKEFAGLGNSNISWQKTVVFNNVYGWHYSQCPSLGIWRTANVEGAPAVRIRDPFVATRDVAKGIVDLVVALEGAGGRWSGKLAGTIAPENFTGQARAFTLPVKSAGAPKRLHLRFRIPNPRLWWPADMGEPSLYRMTLSFVPADGGVADTRRFTFGIRTIAMAPLPGGPRPDKFNWTFVINGKPMFVKGTGWCTLDPLMDFSRPRYERFLTLARDQHCQMIRAWGSGMPETDDFYDLCDRLGIMVVQEWPTAWNSHETQPYDMLEETVQRNMLRIRNHPSLTIYTGGNESGKPFGKAIDMMGRLSIELDGTRAFHRGQPWGGSMHNYDSYWGWEPLDRHLTKEADFFGEFGLACMPIYESVQRYLPDNEKNVWPPLPDGAFAYHTPIFNAVECLARLTQFARYFVAKDADMERFTVGSQLSQAVGLRHQLERARARWPHCTGALYYKMNDNFPAASWATADWYGAAKIGHYFVQDAFAPLHACVLFSSVNNVAAHLALPVYLLDDADALRRAKWSVQVRAYDGQLKEIKRASFDGKGSVKAPVMVGQMLLTFEETDTVPLLVVAEVIKDGVLAHRTFYWVNYEHVKGCLFTLPRTTLVWKADGNRVTVTNTGNLPAVAVNVARPGRLDTFRVSDNYFWLDAGESKTVEVSDSQGLTVSAWNA